MLHALKKQLYVFNYSYYIFWMHLHGLSCRTSTLHVKLCLLLPTINNIWTLLIKKVSENGSVICFSFCILLMSFVELHGLVLVILIARKWLIKGKK